MNKKTLGIFINLWEGLSPSPDTISAILQHLPIMKEKILCCYAKVSVKIIDCILNLAGGETLPQILTDFGQFVGNNLNTPGILYIAVNGLIQAIHNVNEANMGPLFNFLLEVTQTNTQLNAENFYVDIVKTLAEKPEGDPTLLINTVFEKLKPLMEQKEDFHYLRSSVDKLIDLINIVPTGNLETLKSIIYMCEEKLLGSIQSQNQKELQQIFIKAICALYKRGSTNIFGDLTEQTQKLKSIITDINSAQEAYQSINSVFNPADQDAIGVVQQLLIG